MAFAWKSSARFVFWFAVYIWFFNKFEVIFRSIPGSLALALRSQNHGISWVGTTLKTIPFHLPAMGRGATHSICFERSF